MHIGSPFLVAFVKSFTDDARSARRVIDGVTVAGRDMAKVQYGWPVGLPLCQPLSRGLWDVRSSLPSRREARVLFGFHDGMLIALHGFIKKTQRTAADDLALARQRLKEATS